MKKKLLATTGERARRPLAEGAPGSATEAGRPKKRRRKRKARPAPPKDTRAAFVGNWRFTRLVRHDLDYLDILGPAFIRFESNRDGDFRVVGLTADMDCRFSLEGQPARVDFSWHGTEDSKDECGRGWAELTPTGRLRGEILFHMGSEDEFSARRAGKERKREILRQEREEDGDDYR